MNQNSPPVPKPKFDSAILFKLGVLVVFACVFLGALAFAIFTFFAFPPPKITSLLQLLTPVSSPQESSPSPSPVISATSDWKTYTNKERGYSLEYPPSWTIEENGAEVIFYPRLPMRNNLLELRPEISTWIGTVPPEMLCDNLLSGQQVPEGIRDVERIEVDNRQGCRFWGEGAPSATINSYLPWGTEGEVVSITISPPEPGADLLNTYDTLVQTFRYPK